jgi:ATP-dependent helicase/nuclease subunit B
LAIELDANHDVLLGGVIDRVDERQRDGCNEFRVIDYKSGDVQINFDTLYHGLALQLPAYLAAYSASHPGQQAADACYFHFDQPIFAQPADRQTDPESVQKQLDQHFELRSLDLEPAQLEHLQDHTRAKIRQWAGQIVAGQFSARPRQVTGGRLACTYCGYRAICGFDPRNDASERFEPLGRQGQAARRKKKDDLIDRLEQEHHDAADN